MSFEKKKILLVDDDIMFEDMFVSLFENDYEVQLSQSGEDALTKMIKYKPDLILLDIIMLLWTHPAMKPGFIWLMEHVKLI